MNSAGCVCVCGVSSACAFHVAVCVLAFCVCVVCGCFGIIFSDACDICVFGVRVCSLCGTSV